MDLDNQPDLRLVSDGDERRRLDSRSGRRRARPRRPRRRRHPRERAAAAREDRPGAAPRRRRLVLAGADRRGPRGRARRRAHARREVPPAARRPRRRGRRRRGGQADRAAGAQPRRRDPVRRRTAARLKVAITDPQDVRGLDELRLATRLSVEFYVAAKNDVLTELRRLSRAAEAMNATFAEDVAGVEDDEDVDDLDADDGISDAPLVRLVNSMIFEAAEDGASDIHVEPQEDDLVVRYRIDGVLHVAHHIPKRLASGVTTRLKVLAKLDIAERRKPQDGRISLNAAAAGRMLDIRVATLPTVEGEAVTMRLLDKSREVPTLGALGLSDRMSEQMAAILARPTGALLVTGPTGSGKSTTLYARADGDQPARDQHHHRRGPGRVPARRRQPGADQPARRADLRDRAALDPPLRPRRDHGRRDPRRRDRAHLDRGRADGPLRALDAAHERRACRDHAAERDGRRAVPHRRGRLGRPRAAPRAEAVPALRRAVHADVRRAARAPPRARSGRPSLDGCDLPPPPRLRPLRPDRLPRPRRRLPAPHDERAPRAARGREGAARGDRARRRRARACGRCGRTASARSPPASRRSKSSPASAPSDGRRLDANE